MEHPIKMDDLGGTPISETSIYWWDWCISLNLAPLSHYPNQRRPPATGISFFEPGWWFQPIWKILVKMGIFPKVRGENKKHLSCHHPRNLRTCRNHDFSSSFLPSSKSDRLFSAKHAAIATCLRMRTSSLLRICSLLALKCSETASPNILWRFVASLDLGIDIIHAAKSLLGGGKWVAPRQLLLLLNGQHAHPPCVSHRHAACNISPVLRCVVLFEFVFGNLEKMVGWLVVNYS